MNILAICGSLSPVSANRRLLKALGGALPPGVSYQISDHPGQLPHFVPGDSLPESVQQFHATLAAADAVLICTPEYAHGIPGVLKNALDWTVSSGHFYQKPVGLITASSQGAHGHAALLEVLSVLTATIVEEAVVLLPFIKAHIDTNGRIDAQTLQSATDVLHALCAAAAKAPEMS